MNQTDKKALKEFARGATFVIVIMGVVAMVIGIFGLFDTERTPEQKFEVVDSYQGCAVVRYTDETQRWHYFLDCREGR